MTSVAIAHDYLNQRGGAERVVLEMARIWPQAPIYTSLFRPRSTWPGFEAHDVRTTFLDKLPVDKHFRNLFPLYPAAFRSFGVLDADVVISSSSGWAHMVKVRPDAFHAVYCHTPARWLYRSQHLAAAGQASLRQKALRPALGLYRRLDREAARGADLYIANSEVVRQRIMMVYGRDALVVQPPVNTDRFMPTPRGERLLVISRLLPYKRVDVIVDAATRIGVGLDVVGDGVMLRRLQELAGPSVAFHGAVDDATVVQLMQSCRAVCVAAEEDFGIVALEAQAAGKPVVAYGRGGALESVEAGVSGVFFHDLSPEAVIEAISEADRLEAPPEKLAARVERFSTGVFQDRIRTALGDVYAGVH